MRGERPTGTPPLVYLGRIAPDLHKNLGTGGDFTVTGSLTGMSSEP